MLNFPNTITKKDVKFLEHTENNQNGILAMAYLTTKTVEHSNKLV